MLIPVFYIDFAVIKHDKSLHKGLQSAKTFSPSWNKLDFRRQNDNSVVMASTTSIMTRHTPKSPRFRDFDWLRANSFTPRYLLGTRGAFVTPSGFPNAPAIIWASGIVY